MRIQIPQPCKADWQEMTPSEKGRFCQKCQKVVVDFTSKSNQEIITHLHQNPYTCGRFHSKQINTVLKPERNQSIKKWHTYLLGFMTFIGIEIKSHAQQSRVIEGQIVNKESKQPVIGGSIYVKWNTKVGALTDAYGKFKLVIPQDSTTVLVITAIDYGTQEIKAQDIPNTYWTYELEEDAIMGVVIVKKVPFYKRLWWSIRRPFIRKKKKQSAL